MQRFMHRAFIVLAITTLAFSVQASDIELREDHPREYIVQEGDTLWDIAGRFLARPWQWPAIWQANPDIDNPHLIFPGDRITLAFFGGEPRLMVDGTRRLSPEIRREAIEGPISTIPYDAMAPFLRNPRIVDPDVVADLPYIVANFEQRLYAGTGDRTYVRGMDDARVGQEVMIARMTYQFVDRSEENGEMRLRRNRMQRDSRVQVPFSERPAGRVWQATLGQMERFNYPVIGYEMWEAARARVVQAGDPAVLELISGRREVTPGDFVLPIDDYRHDVNFFPRAMDNVPDNARVLAISEAYYGVGHYQIVALSVGTADGVEAGHTFSAFRPGQTVQDRQADHMIRGGRQRGRDNQVTLPDEYAGVLMVFRPFENISYAIVMDGTNAIRENDQLDHPDRRL